MPVSSSDLAIMRAHLARRTPVCPVCASREWEFSDIIAPAALSLPQPVQLPIPGTFLPGSTLSLFSQAPNHAPTQRSVGLAVVICRVCYYVMLFAWKPLKSSSNAG